MRRDVMQCDMSLERGTNKHNSEDDEDDSEDGEDDSEVDDTTIHDRSQQPWLKYQIIINNHPPDILVCTILLYYPRLSYTILSLPALGRALLHIHPQMKGESSYPA